MKPILHAHPLSSYCWKVLLALAEKEIAFEMRLVDLGDPSADQFRALSPAGKMPVLEHDGAFILESSIIIEHLDIHFGGPRMIPADPAAALPVRMLDRLFDNYVMTPVQRIVANRLRPVDHRSALHSDEARAQLVQALGWLDKALAGRSWAAGESFGLADCAAFPSLYYADRIVSLTAWPNLAAYLERAGSRASVREVLAGAAPYAHFFPSED